MTHAERIMGALGTAALAVRYPNSLRSTRALQPYQNDPVAFIHDFIEWQPGQGPASYQDEILAELAAKKRFAVRGPHGLGKTALASWAILWFALTRDEEDWKVPTTASAWRQLTEFLWPEIHKWARRLRWEKMGRNALDLRSELLTLTLKLRTGEAFALASDQPYMIEGAHADHILYVFDEAKAINDGTFDAAEGALSGAGEGSPLEALAFMVSTPGAPVGRFYDVHARRPGFEDWSVRHVTLEECIAAGRMSNEWVEQRRRQWGEQSAVFQNRVKGEFAAGDEDSIIPLAWVEAANERWRAWRGAGEFDAFMRENFVGVGVDVADQGEDKTVFALRFANVISELRRFTKEDPMETAGRTQGILTGRGGGIAVVDVIGIGSGVVARLRENKVPVEPFNASERSDMMDRTKEFGFVNKRAEAWWNLREMLDPVYGEDIALPPDDTLTGDLTAPHWRLMSGAKIQVESKDDIRKRLHRSTDDGDAVVMIFARTKPKPRIRWVG